MRTIAITIDERTLDTLDRAVAASGSGGKGRRRRSRSALVREAIQNYLEEQRRATVEREEYDILHRHRATLTRQARALVREQAEL